MTAVMFSAFLLLQAASPAAAVKVVTGHLSVEAGAPAHSSFTLPLTPSGGAPTPALPAVANRSLMIRPQIDGAFRVQLHPGESPDSAADSAELLINLALDGPSPAVSVSGHVTGIAPGQIQRIALREPTGGAICLGIETGAYLCRSWRHNSARNVKLTHYPRRARRR